jgi:hypothetical protein
LTKNVYVLADKYPAKGYCFPLFAHTKVGDVANDVFVLIEFLNKCQKAHNVFITFGTASSTTMSAAEGTSAAAASATSEGTSALTCLPVESDKNNLKIFVFPRDKNAEKCLEYKEIFRNLNVAFCEICGYVPVGGKYMNILFFLFYLFYSICFSPIL